MSIYCKNCGTELNVDGQKIAVCDFCGMEQTLPTLDNPEKLELFAKANEHRISSRFDIAKKQYESIIAQYPDDNEAYWCKLLCVYGIEYVDDDLTEKKIPTCHRTVTESIFDNSEYKLIMSRATAEEKAIYEAEAKEIDRIQKEILAKADKEEPYDIFICYKESSNDSKKRTIDAQYATKIYTHLTEKGYKVFFSRITLKNKLGTEYEPIIYSALKSAKVMLHVTTNLEHTNAPWVRNEWSRFLEFMNGDVTKIILPCIAQMGPYELPDELGRYQVADMTDLDFYENLLLQINKKFGKNIETKIEEKKEQPVIKATQIEQVNTDSGNKAPDQIHNFLSRAKLSLSYSDWAKANENAEKCLDIDYKCAEAYVIKLMCDFKTNVLENLAQNAEFLDSVNYKQALQFADSELSTTLINLEKQYYYEKAKTFGNNLLSDSVYNSIKECLEKASGYKDADKLLAELPAKRILAEKQKNYELALPFLKSDMTVDGNYKKAEDLLTKADDYKDAKDLLVSLSKLREEQEKAKYYELALSQFKTNLSVDGNYKKAKELLTKADDYKDAKKLLESLPQIKQEQIDAKILAEKQKNYERVLPYLKKDLTVDDNYKKAEELLTKADDYKDAKQLLENLPKMRAEQEKAKFYELALPLLERNLTVGGNYKKAEDLLTKADDYKDAKELLESLPQRKQEQLSAKILAEKQKYYELAMPLISSDLTNDETYEEAKQYLIKADDYKDAKQLLERLPQRKQEQLSAKILAKKQKNYERALPYLKKDLTDEENYKKAVDLLTKADDYKDAKQLLESLPKMRAEQEKAGHYELALPYLKTDLADEENYKKAVDLLTKADDYKDAKELLAQLLKKRDAQIQEEERRKKKKRITVAIIAVASAVLIVFIVLLFSLIIPSANFTKANELLMSGDYSQAIAMYKNLNGWGNSNNKLNIANTLYDMNQGYCSYESGIKELVDNGAEVTVSYNYNGGSTSLRSGDTTFVYNKNNRFNGFPSLSKSGYKFSHWNRTSTVLNITNDSNKIEFAFSASWNITSYTVSYNLNGGNANNIQGYNVTDGTFTLNNPTKTGYTFTGWTGTDLTEKTMTVTIPMGSTGNREYTANWVAIDYEITYNLNGGAVSGNPTKYTIEETVKLNNPTRKGYTFAGWTGTDLSNTTMTVTIPKGSINKREYVANWEINTYNISYTINGGTVSGNPATYTIEETVKLNNPTRKGYTFIGWTGTDLTDKTMTVTIPEGSIEDRSYTANWKANTYTITYDANGGTASKTEDTVTYDSSYTVPTPTRAGYTFVAWKNNGNTYSGGTWQDLADVTLTAEWEINTYNISYTLNGGAVSGNPATYTIEETVKLNNPTRKGYTFIGWTGTDLSEKTMTVAIPDGSTGNREYTANWKANTYTITYDANGGIASKTEDTVTYDSNFTLASMEKREGYYLEGWYDSDGNKYTDGVWKTDKNVILTAKWDTELEYTLVGSGYYVSGINKTQNSYKILSEYKDKPVIGINDSAFEGNTSLTSIEIPNSVTSIGSSAFYECTNLTSIKIPAGVTSIGKATFSYCERLKSIEIPNSVTSIGQSAFSNCDSLTSIEIPNSVTSIGYEAFYNCPIETATIPTTAIIGIPHGKLKTVVINGGTSIGYSAFWSCDSLTSIEIHNSVTCIDGYAFYKCSSLTSIKIPNSVTSIGDYAFGSCSKLTIYCEVTSKPSGWGSRWNPSDRPVVWGYKG